MPSYAFIKIRKFWSITMPNMLSYAFITIRKFWSLTMPTMPIYLNVLHECGFSKLKANGAKNGPGPIIKIKTCLRILKKKTQT